MIISAPFRTLGVLRLNPTTTHPNPQHPAKIPPKIHVPHQRYIPSLPFMSKTRRAGNADDAAMEAAKGAINGAARWGAVSVIAGVIAYFTSPLFRGLTPQFKVYLWMCPTVIGGMVEADRRLRTYESLVRFEQRNKIASAREKEMLDEIEELESRGRKS